MNSVTTIGVAAPRAVRRRHAPPWIAALIVGVLLAAPGCTQLTNSTRRVGKDLAVVFSYPAQAPAAAARDAWQAAGTRPVVGYPLLPVSFLLHFLKHSYATLPYLLDAPFYPLYLLFGPEPIEIYTLDGFPFTLNVPKLEQGAKRSVQSASIALAAPVGVFVASSHDTALYWRSQPLKRWVFTPVVALMHVGRHTLYGIIHGIDAVISPWFMYFGWGPLPFYQWEKYPFGMYAEVNKATNRLYKDIEVGLTAPVGIFVHTGHDWWRLFDRRPVVATVFSPFIVPYQLVKHLSYHLLYIFDGLLYPIYFWNPGGAWDTWELYITGSLEVHPILEKGIGTRAVGALIVLGSGLQVAGAQMHYEQTRQDYEENPTPQNRQRMDDARLMMERAIDDAAANTVVAGTYFALAQAMETTLRNVRGFRRPKTALEFLRFLGEGRESMDELERGPDLGPGDVPQGAEPRSMQHYRDVMNRVLYRREVKLFEECRARILRRFGSLELAGGRVDQLANEADTEALIRVMNELMNAYIVIPGQLAGAQGGVDALTEACDQALEAMRREEERRELAGEENPFARLFQRWRVELLHIRNRAYTQDAIARRLRTLLVEGYIALYEYQAMRY